jgi:steroid delta-isomerase-like uncharacterized protein
MVITDSEIRALLDQFVEAWRRQDPKGMAACYAEDCVIVSPIFNKISSRAQVEQAYTDLFRAFANQTITVDDIVISNESEPARSVLVCTLTSTHVGEIFGMPASGKRIERTIAFIQTLTADRHIARETRIYDFTSMLVQLGVLRVKTG